MSYTNHALQRTAERYGIEATYEEWRGLLLDIWAAVEGAGTAMLLGRTRHGRERWLGRLGVTPVIAVYDPVDARVLTVLPPTTHLEVWDRTQRTWSGRRPDAGPQNAREIAAEDWA